MMRLTKNDECQAHWKTSWDFFTGGGVGAKSGYVTELDGAGCTLKTSEPIEFRRWIRMLIRGGGSNVSFTAVGRVVRCEHRFDGSQGHEVTLYRYRVEFTYPVSFGQLAQVAPVESDVATAAVAPLALVR